MQMTHYISPQEIIAPLKGTTKKGIYEELALRLVKEHNLSDAEKVIKAIMEREESSSTFLPVGIAIPHARMENINDIMLVIGVSPNPVADEGPGSLPLTVQLFCMFLSPTQEKQFGRHLKLLARITSIFSDPDFVSELARLKTPEAVFDKIQLRERAISEE